MVHSAGGAYSPALLHPHACVQLDSHPLAGGLISVRLCTDPMRWVVSSVGTEQVATTSTRLLALHAASALLQASNLQVHQLLSPPSDHAAHWHRQRHPGTCRARHAASAAVAAANAGAAAPCAPGARPQQWRQQERRCSCAQQRWHCQRKRKCTRGYQQRRRGGRDGG